MESLNHIRAGNAMTKITLNKCEMADMVNLAMGLSNSHWPTS